MLIQLRLYVRRDFRIAGATIDSAFPVGRASRKSASQDEAESERAECWFLNIHCQVSFC
jgi:hypothetical protein